MSTYLPFLLFGLWTFACIFAGMFTGAFLMHRKSIGLSPIPRFDTREMFNWIRHGTPEPKEGDTPPPVESVNTIKGL